MCKFKDNALSENALPKSRAPTLLSQKTLLFTNPQPITASPARVLASHTQKQSQPQQLNLTSCICFSKYGEDIKQCQHKICRLENNAAANRRSHYFN